MFKEMPPLPPTTDIENAGENDQEKIKAAEQALQQFMNVQAGEAVLVLIDKDSNQELVDIMSQAAINLGCSIEKVKVNSKTKKSSIDELRTQHPVILNFVSGDYRATDPIYDEVGETGNRMVALFDSNPSLFDADGPMTENMTEMKERLNRMEASLKEAAGFHITSSYGTDLIVPLRMAKERQWFKETSEISAPGSWGNFPGGEIFTTPDEVKVNGTLVLPAVDSASVVEHQGVDEFIRLTIKDGIITNVQGGKSAEILRQKLMGYSQEEQAQERNPFNVLRVAEIAFGANSKARSTVADPAQTYDAPGISVVEAEKRFGTMHLAFGDSKHGEEGTEGHETAVSHLDFVLPRNGLSVEMFKHEDDLTKNKNGRKLIDEGRINFF